MNLLELLRRPESSEVLFDALEPRLALYSVPFLTAFPDISTLASPNNTVVRMQTSMGNIDIELFDRAGPDGLSSSAAPITTANFLRYVAAGHYDGTFFHRLALQQNNERFVLQGGGYKFSEASAPNRAVAIPSFGTIVNEFSTARSNIERTLSMAKNPSSPDSATNQFFFNLADNAHNIEPITGQDFGLDVQNGGFTVFARVIAGWDDVIDSIAELQVRNLDSYLLPNSQAFQTVPTISQSNSDLVFIIDIDIIKPANTSSFYNFAVYFPEGFRSGNTTMTVDLVNLDVNLASHYEIIARFETGSRDVVISSGLLTPGAVLSVPVARAGDASVNVVRGGAPFAIEVRATSPVAASLHHSDFGASTTEAFLNPRAYNGGELRTWSFALGQKGTGVPSYLVWMNLSDQTAALTINFILENGQTHELIQQLEPLRRGGLNLAQLPDIPAGAYSVEITSNQPIVAALSQYRANPGRAAIEGGTAGGPATEGVLPGAVIPNAAIGQAILSVALPHSITEQVSVDFEFILANGTVLSSPGLFTLNPDMRRHDIDLSSAHGALPVDQFFTIRYRVAGAAAPISASYVGLSNGQMMRTAFQTSSSREVFFAGASTNPDSTGPSDGEFISIFNPHTDPEITVTYFLRFHFVESGGDEIIFAAGLGTGVIANGESVHINVRDLSNIMARITSGTQFRFYGVSVLADIRQNEEEVQGAVFAQFTRLDAGGRTSTFGPSFGEEYPRIFLNDPDFI